MNKLFCIPLIVIFQNNCYIKQMSYQYIQTRNYRYFCTTSTDGFNIYNNSNYGLHVYRLNI